MTVDECRENIGSGVVYTPWHGRREDGVITSVADAFAFVRYSGDNHSKATNPADLALLSGGVA